MGFVKGTSSILLTMIASLMFILMGVVYFMLTVWMIKVGANWAGFSAVEGSTVVLTAGIITAAIVIGSAIQK